MITVSATDLLIAPPNLPDPKFRNTVLMVTHDTDNGSFALCVNKPTDYVLPDVLLDSDVEVFNMPNLPIYWGGPVSPRSLWMMHSAEWQTKGTVLIDDTWAMTSSEEMFHNLADGDCPQHFRIVMGYCAWAEGQLKQELNGISPWRREHAWLVAQNLGPEWLFDQNPDDLWAAATTLCSHQAVDSWL